MAIRESKTALARVAEEDGGSAGQDNFWNAFMTRLRWYPKDMPITEKDLVSKLVEARSMYPHLWLLVLLHQVSGPAINHECLRIRYA